METLTFHGPAYFRQRLVLSVLSSIPIDIENVRSMDENPGLKSYEIALLKLIDTISNGSISNINKSGTIVYFKPGSLHGGKHSFDCGLDRCISYFLEFLLYLAPFCKTPLEVTLTGLTATRHEMSVDTLKMAVLPTMRKFLLNDELLDIKVQSRGLLPNGGGRILMTAPVSKVLKSVIIEKMGKVRKIRGTAFACKVSPQMANRTIEGAKSILKPIVTDMYVTVDSRKGGISGFSPGFGMTLTAETTEGIYFTADALSRMAGEDPVTPEDVGNLCAERLLEEIYRGGTMDSRSQCLAFLYMALGPQDVSKIITGPLSEYSAQFLRHIDQFLHVRFRMESLTPGGKSRGSLEAIEDDLLRLGTDKIRVTGMGVGFSNVNKRIT